MPLPSPPPTSVHHIIILYLYLKSPLHSSSTITPAPLAIFNIVAINDPTHRYYYIPCRQHQRGPIKSRRIIATHYYCCRWLITNIRYQQLTVAVSFSISMLSSLVKRQTGHDVDCYPGGCCRVKMTSFTIAWKTAITISHFSYPLHILTVTTTTIHQRIVSHFIRYLYFR